ncbi:MAG: hypothetical protein JWR74_3215 [Polaromonas sp.]|nr:hypothetical protein [Polaromonas sp.]
MRLADTLDRLIEKARTAMNGDPRHEDAVCASPEPAYSCELEGDLAELSGKFARANRILRSVIDRIQL